MDKKKIGVLTSGGDAPGMNACIRAVTRTALSKGFQVMGIRKGYNGLIAGEFTELSRGGVSDIIHRGGTTLLTARSQEMFADDGVEKAANVAKVLGLDCLVVIGGDGSFKGAKKLADKGVNVMCIPATIDLDVSCSEYTIGFDTAVNTGMEAINKLRDTSSSHERCSVVEVMGRNAGYIAIWCGISGGAEEVLFPEMQGYSFDDVIALILKNRSSGRKHNLIVVAEGVGHSVELAEEIQKVTNIDARATILGHLQRGGSPTALDRVHASMMGYHAVQLFDKGASNRIVVYRNGAYQDVDLTEGLEMKKEFDLNMYNIAKVLSV